MARPISSVRRQTTAYDLENSDDKPSDTARPIHIYTDGGCLDNPGPGGYGAVIMEGDRRIELSGGYRLTTNNRMEIMACIKAIGTLKKNSQAVLFTDSKYVANAIEKGWALKWRSKNWMRDKNNRAVNSDLWAEMLMLLEHHDVVFRWVRGHAGNPENERCDVLAKKAAQGKDLEADSGYEKAIAEMKESSCSRHFTDELRPAVIMSRCHRGYKVLLLMNSFHFSSSDVLVMLMAPSPFLRSTQPGCH